MFWLWPRVARISREHYLDSTTQELVGEEIRPLTVERRAEILQTNEELTGTALRTLGGAFRSLPKDAFRRESRNSHSPGHTGFRGFPRAPGPSSGAPKGNAIPRDSRKAATPS